MMLNQELISKSARENETSRHIFEELGNRQRDRGMVDLRRLRIRISHKGFKVVTQDYARLFKQLEKAGAGKMIMSKMGNPQRFEFFYSMKEVVTKDLTALTEPIPYQPKGHVAYTNTTPTGKLVAAFPIRGNPMSFELPIDLSRSEAESLADFIRRLGH